MECVGLFGKKFLNMRESTLTIDPPDEGHVIVKINNVEAEGNPTSRKSFGPEIAPAILSMRIWHVQFSHVIRAV